MSLSNESVDNGETEDTFLSRRSLLSFEPAALETEITALGLPRFRARQLWRWIWRHGITDFADMTDLGKSAQALLAELLKQPLRSTPAEVRHSLAGAVLTPDEALTEAQTAWLAVLRC